MINTDIKNVEKIELNIDAFGLKKGSQFVRENGIFVNTSKNTIDSEMCTYTRTETRKYADSIIAEYKDIFDVVEYTEKYLQEVEERWLKASEQSKNTLVDVVKDNKPFKSRKQIRKQIRKYEDQLNQLDADGALPETKEQATTLWNMIKVLKWAINE